MRDPVFAACVSEIRLHADRRRKERGTYGSVNRLAFSREYQRQRRKERHAMIAKLKSIPCMDCGHSFDPVCMDFDHRPGEEKRGNVARILHAGTDDQLIAEIEKCDVVCSNCHRLRTKKRR